MPLVLRVRTFFNSIPHKELIFVVILPYLIWLMSFSGYFLGQRSLTVDAISYFDHIAFLTDNLKVGVYPLWNPAWETGAPYSFFLRRMGDVNPIFWLIVILKWFGMGQCKAHMVFLALYYFLAMSGFYLLARRLFQDKIYAFLAYGLLMFSAWGAQLFYNYIILLLAPMAWFFYFFIAFARDQRRHQFLGMALCFGILVTTYIPFYFMTALLWAAGLGACLFFSDTLTLLRKTLAFIRGHKVLAVGTALFLVLSLLPAAQFYHESTAREFALPGRSEGAASVSAVAVGANAGAPGDLITHRILGRVFEGHADLLSGEFYIPFVFFLLFLFGIFSPLSRRKVFLSMTVVFMGMISVTTVTPVYAWLYEHLFPFHFIRQFYYFFWFFVLPAGILLAVDGFRSFVLEISVPGKDKRLSTALVFLLAAAFFGFIAFRPGVWWSGLLSLSCGIAVVLLMLMRKDKGVTRWGLGILLLCAVVIHGVALNRHILKKAPLGQAAYQFASFEPKTFYFQRADRGAAQASSQGASYSFISGGYYSAAGYSFLANSLSWNIFGEYLNNLIYLVNNVQPYDKDADLLPILEGAMAQKADVAFVSRSGSVAADWKSQRSSGSADAIRPGDPRISVRKFNANGVVFKTVLPHEKFLVMTDAYHTQWQVFIDGKKERLLRTNIAFKGVWVPAGEHVVEFRFSSFARIFQQVFLMGLFGLVLFLVCFWAWRDRNLRKEEALG